MPIICMQHSYVNVIVLVWISCITGQTADRYYGRGASLVSDYMGSSGVLVSLLKKLQKARQPQVVNTRCALSLLHKSDWFTVHCLVFYATLVV